MAGDRRSLAERREQLLDAAVEVMSDKGVRGATTRSITEHAGVPHGAFHYCFDSKDLLIRALLEREIERARSDEAAGAEQTKSLEQWLNRALAGRVRQAMEVPKREIVLAELSQLGRTSPALAVHLRCERERYMEAVHEAIAARSDLDDSAVRDMTSLIVASVAGIVDVWLLDRNDDNALTSVALLARACLALARQ